MEPEIHYLSVSLLLLLLLNGYNYLKKKHKKKLKQCEVGYKKNYFVAYHPFSNVTQYSSNACMDK